MRPFLLLAAVGFLAPSVHAQAVALLRANDVLEMRLSGMPQEFSADFAQQYTVAQDGMINVPLIGEVKALGLTSSQLEKAVQARLVAEKIFTRPTIIINVAQVARFVSISGGVRAPGRQQWTPDMTLGLAIGAAGGLSDFGKGKGVRIIRDRKVAGVYDLKEINKNPEIDPKVFPGDQILVAGD